MTKAGSITPITGQNKPEMDYNAQKLQTGPIIGTKIEQKYAKMGLRFWDASGTYPAKRTQVTPRRLRLSATLANLIEALYTFPLKQKTQNNNLEGNIVHGVANPHRQNNFPETAPAKDDESEGDGQTKAQYSASVSNSPQGHYK